jgi:hypothetical protein
MTTLWAGHVTDEETETLLRATVCKTLRSTRLLPKSPQHPQAAPRLETVSTFYTVEV